MRPIGTKPNIFLGEKFIVANDCRMSGISFFKDEVVIANDTPISGTKGVYFDYMINNELNRKGSINFSTDLYFNDIRLRYPYKNEIKLKLSNPLKRN